MATIDLGSPPPAAPTLLEGLPRRVALTLPELRLVAERSGGAPLPFDVIDPAAGSGAPAPGRLSGRLGGAEGTGGLSGAAAEDTAFAGALAGMHDPETSLCRRGLLADPAGLRARTASGGSLVDPGLVESGLAGAVGLLAAPTTAVDLEIVAGGVHGRSWHRSAEGAVATLSTLDGLVFELAWLPTSAWAAELSRVAVLPEDVELADSALPDLVDLPFELADAAAEAVSSTRADLLPVLVAQHTGRVSGGRVGEPLEVLTDHDVVRLLTALSTEARGRLRALTADVSSEVTTVVGVVSWTLLADGWRALTTHQDGTDLRLRVRRVEPADMAATLAPVIAEVTTVGAAVGAAVGSDR